MAEFILIDNERLKIMKVTRSLEAAEYWTEILCRNTDTTLDARGTARFLSKYTDMELRMLFYNATGQVIPPNTEYGDTLKLVYDEVIKMFEIDETPVSVLKEILGRDLRSEPTVTVPAPDNSTTRVAKAPKQAASGVSHNGEGVSVPSPPKGGTTARVWEIANEVFTAMGEGEVDLKELRKGILEQCEKEGINPSTAGTQYSKWKRHQNL